MLLACSLNYPVKRKNRTIMSLALETPAIEKAVSALKFRSDAFVDGRFAPALVFGGQAGQF